MPVWVLRRMVGSDFLETLLYLLKVPVRCCIWMGQVSKIPNSTYSRCLSGIAWVLRLRLRATGPDLLDTLLYLLKVPI